MLPLHPRNKLLIYQRYILSKISWDLTVANLRLTWVKQTLDSILHKYVRDWLEIPISGTLNIISLSREKFGLGFVNVSSRFIQCQSTIRNCLKNSGNSDIRRIYKETSKDVNLQYDCFTSSKDAIKNIRSAKEKRINEKLTTQALVIKSIWKYTMKSSKNIWQKVLEKLPRNIYSFCVRYTNNNLANGTNMFKWGRSESSICLACKNPQTLGHVVGGCVIHLNEGRYNFRHNSVLLNLVNSIKSVDSRTIYADINGYSNPSIVTGDEYRPDLVVTDRDRIIVFELSIGFETNLENNTSNKANRYKLLLNDLKSKFKKVDFVNLSMVQLGRMESLVQIWKVFWTI